MGKLWEKDRKTMGKPSEKGDLTNKKLEISWDL
jgi:hypothetical protein